MIDLRTDFISRPTPAMIEAMVAAAASLADFSLRDDPIVARLERLAAERLGKADALFCPTCTMANQIAIHLACRPGDAFVAEAASHVLTSEAGIASALSGAVPVPVPGRCGVPDLNLFEEALAARDPSRSRTGLIVVENTHVMSGGHVMPLAIMQAIRAMGSARGIPIHLDGARLFNAAAYLQIDARELAATADTLAVSLNKGLCAPMGAVLAGPKSAIEEAARIRHMLGGAWRPANIPAAAAIVALETMADRLVEDHMRAADLARGLARLAVVDVDPSSVETNIILVRVNPPHGTVSEITHQLAERKVLVLPFGKETIRLCLHREIGAEEVAQVVTAFETIEAELQPSRLRAAERPLLQTAKEESQSDRSIGLSDRPPGSSSS